MQFFTPTCAAMAAAAGSGTVPVLSLHVRLDDKRSSAAARGGTEWGGTSDATTPRGTDAPCSSPRREGTGGAGAVAGARPVTLLSVYPSGGSTSATTAGPPQLPSDTSSAPPPSTSVLGKRRRSVGHGVQAAAEDEPTAKRSTRDVAVAACAPLPRALPLEPRPERLPHPAAASRAVQALQSQVDSLRTRAGMLTEVCTLLNALASLTEDVQLLRTASGLDDKSAQAAVDLAMGLLTSQSDAVFNGLDAWTASPLSKCPPSLVELLSGVAARPEEQDAGTAGLS